MLSSFSSGADGAVKSNMLAEEPVDEDHAEIGIVDSLLSGGSGQSEDFGSSHGSASTGCAPAEAYACNAYFNNGLTNEQQFGRLKTDLAKNHIDYTNPAYSINSVHLKEMDSSVGVEEKPLPVVFAFDAAFSAHAYRRIEGADRACLNMLATLNGEYDTWEKALATSQFERVHHIPFPLDIPAEYTYRTVTMDFDSEGFGLSHGDLSKLKAKEPVRLQLDSDYIHPRDNMLPVCNEQGHEPLIHAVIVSARLIESQNTSCMPVNASFVPTWEAHRQQGQYLPRENERIHACTRRTEHRDKHDQGAHLYTVNPQDPFFAPEAARLMRIDPSELCNLAELEIRKIHQGSSVPQDKKFCRLYLKGDSAIFLPEKDKKDLVLWFAVTYRKQIHKESERLGLEVPCYKAATQVKNETVQQSYLFSYQAFCNVVRVYCDKYDPSKSGINLKALSLLLRPTREWSEIKKCMQKCDGAFANNPQAIAARVEVTYIAADLGRFSNQEPHPSMEYRHGLAGDGHVIRPRQKPASEADAMRRLQSMFSRN